MRQRGFSKEELERINHVKLHQQVLFLLCVLGASDKTPDKQHLNRHTPEENWSTLQFPKENPPNKDLILLGQALQQLNPAWGIMDRFGRFRHEGYSGWVWQHDEQQRRQLHLKGETMDVYRLPSSTISQSAV